MERFAVDMIIPAEDSGDGARLPALLLDRLRLPADKAVALRCGMQRIRTRLRVDRRLPPDKVRIPASLAGRLGLRGGVRMGIWSEGGATLAFGPLIGCMVSRQMLRDMEAGDAVTDFLHMASAAREIGGLLIFFHSGDIHWEQAEVRGRWINPRRGRFSRLEAGRFPLPRVILYPSGLGSGPDPHRLETRARTAGCTILAHRHIRKLEAFDILRRVPAVRRYLPYTAPLTPATLRRAMEAYDDLYLKPDDLSRGRGVHRLTRQGARGWLLTHRGTTGNVDRTLPDPGAVREAVAPLLRARSPYLIQEGLPLATFLGNRFDVRVLVQKNGRGRWTVSGIAARLAPIGSAITSPRSGGLVAPPQQVLGYSFPGRADAVVREVRQAALSIAEAIDAALGPRYELGIDLGVLRDGSVRLIEVNGRPLTVSLQRLRDPFAAERIGRYPVHYAAWLDAGGDRR